MKRILSYWCVWGVFTFAEYFVDFFVWWIPLYYEAKLLALFCLVGGNFSGAMFVFDNLIEEALSHHEFEIDASLTNFKKTMKQTGGRMLHSMYDGATSMAGVAMKKVRDTEHGPWAYLHIHCCHRRKNVLIHGDENCWCLDEQHTVLPAYLEHPLTFCVVQWHSMLLEEAVAEKGSSKRSPRLQSASAARFQDVTCLDEDAKED